MTFTCPRCQTPSQHPEDAAHGYCGACHDFTATPTMQAANVEQGRAAVLQTFPALAGLPVVKDPTIPAGETRIVDAEGVIAARIIDRPA